ncbi:MAG: hypothetical protein CMO55_05980 [Verrucomicrobiales bacterium]|nr:hypothetical protein [Verrucomicrobiales bacterium]
MAKTNADIEDLLWSRAEKILSGSHFRNDASGFDRRTLIRRANDIGGLKMHLLHSSKVEELGRIPESSEGTTVEAISGIELYGASRVEVVMVSHRWLRPSIDIKLAHPDSESNCKAKVINEYTKWRRKWVKHKHGFLPEIYYWIDYSCVDQSQTANAVPLLPIWVACCERFLQIETPEYHDRAWCRVETILSHIFSFADHHTVVDLGFRCRWPDSGVETEMVICDPECGATTKEEDKPLLRRLTSLIRDVEPVNSMRPQIVVGETKIKCYRL